MPQLYMRNADGWWYHQETGVSCDLYDGPHERDFPWLAKPDSNSSLTVKDARYVGIAPWDDSIDVGREFDCVWAPEGDAVMSWKEEREGAHYIATAFYQSGAVAKWWINPDRGWNAERIALYSPDGAIAREVLCELKNYSGVWFPHVCTYKSMGKTARVFTTESAALNQPGDKATFTAADLKLEAGTNIWRKSAGPDPREKLAIWDGDKISTLKVFNDEVRLGKRQRGPTFQKMRETGRFSSPYDLPDDEAKRMLAERDLELTRAVRKHELLWERFVCDYITRHQLDDEQQQRAWTIHRDCLKTAGEYHDVKTKPCWPRLRSLKTPSLPRTTLEYHGLKNISRNFARRWTRSSNPR